MKLISFDIGIKNLALCIINNTIKDTYKIEHWDLLNIDDEKNKCEYNNKCKGKKMYELSNDKEKKIYCNNHKNKLMYKIEKNNTEKCDICGNETIYISKLNNKKVGGWCKTHKDENKKYKNDYKTKLIKNEKSTIENKGMILYKLLDKLDINDIDMILIENQPSMKNPVMKTISILVYSYFILRKLDNKYKYEIKLIAPSRKLKVKEESTEILENTNENKIYKTTKNLSIKYCLELISDKDKEILNKYKKKDDLCDAFLQGYYYLTNIFGSFSNKN